MSSPDIQEALETIAKLCAQGFRFSVIHNPTEKRFNIVSCTNPDLIKKKFPEFNIYLSGRREKMVEKIIFY